MALVLASRCTRHHAFRIADTISPRASPRAICVADCVQEDYTIQEAKPCSWTIPERRVKMVLHQERR